MWAIFQCGPFEGDGATLRPRRGMAPHWEQSTYSQYSGPQSGNRTRRAEMLTRFVGFSSFRVVLLGLGWFPSVVLVRVVLSLMEIFRLTL